MIKDLLLQVALRWISGRVTKFGVLSLHIKKKVINPLSPRGQIPPREKGLSKFTFNGTWMPLNETWFSFKFRAIAYCEAVVLPKILCQNNRAEHPVFYVIDFIVLMRFYPMSFFQAPCDTV